MSTALTSESLAELTSAQQPPFEVDLGPGVPRSMTEALGDVLTEPHQTVASYGGVGGAHAPMHHGHGDKRGEADKDAKRFFRAIDRAVLEHLSRVSGLPLILAALPEHHHRFRQASHNPFLLAEGLVKRGGQLLVIPAEQMPVRTGLAATFRH